MSKGRKRINTKRERFEEVFLKDKLEKELNVSIKRNVDGDDPPDLEFELEGKRIGIEISRVMPDMNDGESMIWVFEELKKIIESCLEEFEKNYARIIRSEGERKCFECSLVRRVVPFMEREDASKETFNSIRGDIEKTIMQGLKVFFRLPEVENEMFFSDKSNLRELRGFWNAGLPGCPLYRGWLEGNGDSKHCFIEMDNVFDLAIFCRNYSEGPVPDDKLFLDDPIVGFGYDNEGPVPSQKRIQDIVYEKKHKCIKKLGLRKDDPYDEMWLYLYDEVNQILPQNGRERLEAMSLNFGNYWSKVCLFTAYWEVEYKKES